MKKWISKILLFSMMVSIFALPIKASATVTWQEVITPDAMAEFDMEIKYTYGSNHANFVQLDGYGEWIRKDVGADDRLTDRATPWRAKGPQFTKQIFVIVDEAPSPKKVLNFCFRQDQDLGRNFNVVPYVLKYPTHEDKYWCFGSTEAGWVEHTLPTYYPVGSEGFSIMSNVREDLMANRRNVAPFERPSAPLAANITSCESNKVKPAIFGATNDELKTLFNAIKSKLLESPENQDDSQVINDFFNDISNDTNVLDSMKDRDKTNYERFYGQINRDYPTIALTENVYQDYLILYHDLEINKPASFETDGWVKTVRNVAAGAAGVAVGLLVPGTLGIYVGAGVGAGLMAADGWIEGLGQRAQWKEALPKAILLYTATNYMDVNNEVNKCFKTKADPYAFVNNRITNFTRELTDEAMEDLGEDTNTDGGGYCGSMIDLSFAKIIAKAFCGLGLILHSAAKSFVTWANGWLSAVIGTSDGF